MRGNSAYVYCSKGVSSYAKTGDVLGDRHSANIHEKRHGFISGVGSGNSGVPARLLRALLERKGSHTERDIGMKTCIRKLGKEDRGPHQISVLRRRQSPDRPSPGNNGCVAIHDFKCLPVMCVFGVVYPCKIPMKIGEYSVYESANMSPDDR